MKLFRFFILFFLFLSSCRCKKTGNAAIDDMNWFCTCGNRVYWSHPIHWKFDCNFPEELKEYVRAAQDFWNGTVGWTLLSEEFDCTAIESVEVRYEQVANSLYDGFTKYYYNDCLEPTEEMRWLIIFFSNWSDNPDIRRHILVRHEFGHLLGLDHVSNPDCLMFHKGNDSGQLCPQEHGAVWAQYGWGN